MQNIFFSDSKPNIVKNSLSQIHTYIIWSLTKNTNERLKNNDKSSCHLKKTNFRLFSEGQEYTQYYVESFESLFPSTNYVVFSIQKADDEVFEEAELLLQINSPCKVHAEKFLIFYCFDCNCSICCDCFLFGYIQAIIYKINVIIYCLLNF